MRLKNLHPLFFEYLTYVFLLILSLSLIFIHRIDKNLANSWLILELWLLNCFFAFVFVLKKISKSLTNKILLFIQNEWKTIALLFLVAVLTRSFLINSYPFVKLGDEIRDAGLATLRIKKRVVIDFFGFGPYNASGNIVPLAPYFLTLLMRDHTLNYLIAAASVGVLSIIFTYVLAYIVGNKITAFTASVFLIGSLTHLHYSRTEFLVITDSLLSLLIILIAYVATLTTLGVFLIGLVAGIAMHFYAAVRGIILISVIYLFFSKFIKIIKKKNLGQTQTIIKELILLLTLFIFGFLIGLGPRINHLSPKTLLANSGAEQFILFDPAFLKQDFLSQLNFLYKTYEKALMVYIFEPTNDIHFKLKAPLLSFPLNWLFIVGIVYAIFFKKDKRDLINLLVANVIFFPMINEVAINQLGMDHRLMGIVPILNIVAAFGLLIVVDKISHRYAKFALILFFTFYLSWQLGFYFLKRPSDLELTVKDYVFQSVLNHIKHDRGSQGYYILNGDSSLSNYSLLHYQEQMEFFTYPKEVVLLDKETFFNKLAEENSKRKKSKFIFINEIPELAFYPKLAYTADCGKKSIIPAYNCPLDSKGSYTFYKVDFNQ